MESDSTPQSRMTGEMRGDRKRARAAATTARREAQEKLSQELSTPPATSADAALRWDEFYKTKPSLFKDRHLLRAEFPEMMSEHARDNPREHVPPLQPAPSDAPLPRDPHCDLTLVEAGCGVGNGIFPVLRANYRLFAYAFDYSAKAVDIVKKNEEYRTDRMKAFQADLSNPGSYINVIKKEMPEGTDFVTALWTLSALPPGEQQRAAATGLASLLKTGGLLFVRDYAEGDMREVKFTQRGQGVECVEGSGRLFLRGDGTFAYFFEAEELRKLLEASGLICETCEYVDREVYNRKEQMLMRRRWIHAKFRKKA